MMFDSIAYRYDLLNHLLSVGLDRYWRRKLAEHVRAVAPKRILDVATGTADSAIATLQLKPQQVIGVDIAEEMLRYGRMKLARKGLDGIITLQKAEAESLPFETGTFDAAIVAFGARNFADLNRGLAEMHRMLRPGGMIAVLEFSKPTTFGIKQLYLFYFQRIIPRIGQWISGSRIAYRYLPETVMRFPDGSDFLSILQKVGFSNTQEDRLTFGVVSIYTGIK
jgi:demethylmenaquinone methyltransferase/2-methoxy-6-polyprenyl-1,4-benzoquinol methylase